MTVEAYMHELSWYVRAEKAAACLLLVQFVPSGRLVIDPCLENDDLRTFMPLYS